MRAPILLFMILLGIALMLGVNVKIGDLERSLAACKAERPIPPPPKCRYTEGDVREAVAGWENAVDIATMCVIDLDVCRQDLLRGSE